MTSQFVPASSLYILSAIVTFSLAYVTWRLKPERGLTWIMVMICAGIWAIGSTLETIPTDLETKFRIVKTVPYLGITGSIFFWSLFTIIYSRHKYWLNKFTIFLLAVVPVTTYVLVFTSQYHPLIWESYSLVAQNGYVFFNPIYGIGFWIWAVYGYLVILCGAYLIITAVVRSPRLYQGQAFVLILGSLIPLISNLLYLVKLNPIDPLDLSPISFTITGILITIGLLRFQLFSVVPIAHDLVFKGVTSGVIVIDLKAQIIDLNPAAETILNQDKNKLVGKNILDTFPEYKSVIEQFSGVWDAKTEISFGVEQRIFELQIMPLTNRSGKGVAGRIILLYDITERKKALAERDSLIRELDAYAHTVAHDLKTPLAIIQGYSGLIMRKNGETLPDSTKEYLHTIDKTTQKMGEIIDSLLLLASIQSVDDLEISPIDMAEIAHNAWSRVSRNETTKLVNFTMAETIWPTAVGYAPWVEQVWVNYMSNAIKYGGSPPQVEIGFDLPNDHFNGTRPSARFWVKDNGNGLSEEEAAQLFQKFVRLAQHETVGGHGLGLSIVQRIIDRLGGQVGVESQEAKGSIFYFTLPLVESQPFDSETVSHPEQIALNAIN